MGAHASKPQAEPLVAPEEPLAVFNSSFCQPRTINLVLADVSKGKISLKLSNMSIRDADGKLWLHTTSRSMDGSLTMVDAHEQPVFNMTRSNATYSVYQGTSSERPVAEVTMGQSVPKLTATAALLDGRRGEFVVEFVKTSMFGFESYIYFEHPRNGKQRIARIAQAKALSSSLSITVVHNIDIAIVSALAIVFRDYAYLASAAARRH
ncbi:hypothetical protein RI367_003448 [Sorochytrium milnesiophthora]